MGKIGVKKIGRYEIESEIGRGGMAVVYKARDTRLDRPVAIKLIQTGAFASNALGSIRERFEREAKALARLDHPNIVKVYDYGEYEGAPYLVMDYLDGATLKELKKPVRVDTAVKLLTPIADALEYVHRHGLLHRDIKPSNIMITSENRLVLTDFGIVKWLEDDGELHTLTATGVGIGTPEYMSPEQGRGMKVDERSDMYSLSVVFYELITGKKPFTADTPVNTLLKQISEPIPDPRQLVPEINPSVKKFLDRAMAKSPSDRYPSMKEYLLDLEGLRLQAQAQAKAPATNTGVQSLPLKTAVTAASLEIGKSGLREVRANVPNTAPRIPTGNPRRRSWVAGILGLIAICFVFFGVRAWNTLHSKNAQLAADLQDQQLTADAALTQIAEVAERESATQIANMIASEAAQTQAASATAVANMIATEAARTEAASATATANAYLTESAAETAAVKQKAVAWMETETHLMTGTVEKQRETALANATLTAQAQADNRSRIATAQANNRSNTATAQAVESQETGAEIEDLIASPTRHKNFAEVRRTLDQLDNKKFKIPVNSSGSLKHVLNESVEIYSTNYFYGVKNFILEVTFKNPFSSKYSSFDYGVFFRDSGKNDEYGLVVDSNSTWQLRNFIKDTNSVVVQEGELPDFNIGSDETNSIILIVQGDNGLFYVNERFIAELNLSDRTNSGFVSLMTGFFSGNEAAGFSTEFNNYSLYKLGY